jgi:hypothetical protein
MSGVLIRNQETGRVLPPAPEFGEDGRWPPLVTEWLPLRWELFEIETRSLDSYMAYVFFTLHRSRDPLLAEDNRPSSLIYEPSFPDCSVIAKIVRRHVDVDIRFSGDSLKLQKKRLPFLMDELGPWGRLNEALRLLPVPSRELRRLVHYVRWRRKDPVTQLPPGSTQEMMHSVTTGLSVERSQELAGSLGLSLGANVTGVQAKLSSQLQQTFGFKLDITAQEEMSTKLTLTNQSNDRYRLFALWHLDHLVTVEALSVPVKSRKFTGFSCSGHQASWTRRGSAEFMTSNEPFITFAEIGRS